MQNNKFRRTLLFSIMIILLFLASGCSKPRDNSTVYFIKNVNIIAMDREGILENYNVLITGDKIVKLGKPWRTRPPKDARIIDGEGKYLTPGLTDMHVHLWYDDELMLYLANGVTTIRDMFGDGGKLILRDKIDKGETLGPKLYVASPIMDGKPPIWPGSTVINSEKDADAWVSRYKKMNYDFIKIYERLTEEAYDDIIAAGKKEDIPVVGHIPEAVDIEKALVSGQRSIEHLVAYRDSDELYDLTIENGVWNCPTIVVHEMFTRGLDREKVAGIEYAHPYSMEYWEERMDYPEDLLKKAQIAYQEMIDQNKIITKKLYDKGGRILLGTDANNPFIMPGFSLHDELANLVEAGLSPYQAIKTGTYDAAEFLNILDSAGTIEKGKTADLILLSKNPLEDIGNMKKIEGVMVRGQWIDREEIDGMLRTVIHNNKAF